MADTVIQATITIPEARAATALAQLQLEDPPLQGEGTNAYVKRQIQILVNTKVWELTRRAAVKDAAANTPPPGITVI